LLKRLKGSPGAIALVAYLTADAEPVLLLDVGLVVLAVTSAAGEGDLLPQAPGHEDVVDELRAVIGMEGLQGKGEAPADEVYGCPYSLLAHPPHRLELRPAASDVYSRQGRKEEALSTVAAMEDEVSLEGAGRHTLPLAPGPDGHLALQGRSGRPLPLGVPEAAGPVSAQQPVDGGGADLEEERPQLRRDLELVVSLQGGQKVGHDRGQELAAHPVTHPPELDQGGGKGHRNAA